LRILSNAAVPTLESDTTFAAFKALPIDPARTRRASGSFVDSVDELAGATNCKEAVNLIIEAIHRACHDIGGTDGAFISEAEIVR